MSEMGSTGVVSKWMLEFAVDKFKDDRLVAKTLSVGSVWEADFWLKKILLLRAIESEVSECSVSDKMLDVFEMVLHLDKEQGVGVLESMKEAYCKVAIDCVARYVKRIGEEDRYLDAVKRVWRKRIGRLFANNVDLVSDQLEIWGDVVESGIWDDKMREHLFDSGRSTRHEALIAVKGYLDEAWKTVRPKFLDIVSGLLGKSLVESQQMLLQRISKPNEGEAPRSLNTLQEMGKGNNPASQHGGDANVSRGPSNLFPTTLLNNKDHDDVANTLSQNLGCSFQHPTDDKHEGSNATTGANIMSLHQGGDARLAVSGIPKEQDLLQTSAGLIQDQSENVEPAHSKGTCEEQEVDLPSSAAHGNLQSPNHSNAHYKDTSKVKVRRKHVAGPIKRFRRARIDDSEDVDSERADKQHDPLAESNVIKIHEQLKSRVRELQHVVKDPLPEALHVAEKVLVDSSRNFIPQCHPTASHKQRGNDEAYTSSVNEIRTTSMEGDAMNMNTNQDYERDPAPPPEAVCVGDKKIQNADSGHENHRHRANLWERGANACVYEWDDSVDGSPEEQHGLPTPKNYVNSPLKKYGSRNFARRRQIKRWSVLEEDTLRAGVQRFGKGNWKFILNAYREIFQERTAVDLKDKWRCMIS